MGLCIWFKRPICQNIGKRVFNDFFVLDDEVILKPYNLDLFGENEFKKFSDEKGYYFSTDKVTDFDYIAPAELNIIDDICKSVGKLDFEQIKEQINDFAVKKAKNRFLQDPDIVIITDIDMAKAGGAKGDLIDYIIENKVVERALGIRSSI